MESRNEIFQNISELFCFNLYLFSVSEISTLPFYRFKIFDDTTAYAIWRFVYPNLSYDRLTAMMEFNILNNMDTVKAEIEALIKQNRNNLNN